MALPLLLLVFLIPLSLTILFLNLTLSVFAHKHAAPKLPPGPTRLPFIGNLHNLGNLPHRYPLLRTLFRLSRKHGPLMFLKLGAVPTVVASSAEAAREFISIHEPDCCSRPLQTSTGKLSYNYQDVGLVPYGTHWRDMRKLIIDEFTCPRVLLLNRAMREEETHRMITSISSSRSPVDLSHALHALSIDITCRAAFGSRYSTRLREIINEQQAMLAGFFYADYLPSLGWLDCLTGMRARPEKNYLALDSFFEEMIEEHTDPTRRLVDDRGDMLDALLRIQKEDEVKMPRDRIKALLMDVLIAGSDSSSAAVEWAMSELMRNPRVMKKVQDEVRSVVGRKGKAEESDLPQLHYMRCVVKEVMRLHPPDPLLILRETLRPFDIGCFHIPAKTRVIINAWAIGREEGNWENPEEFYPERFIDSAIDMKGHDFGLIPFGSGRRMCPGMHLGLAVVELGLANLLYSFNWEMPEGMTAEEIDMDEALGIGAHRENALRLVANKYNPMEG